MEVSYNKQWKLLIDPKVKWVEMREVVDINTVTLAKLGKKWLFKKIEIDAWIEATDAKRGK